MYLFVCVFVHTYMYIYVAEGKILIREFWGEETPQGKVAPEQRADPDSSYWPGCMPHSNVESMAYNTQRVQLECRDGIRSQKPYHIWF